MILNPNWLWYYTTRQTHPISTPKVKPRQEKCVSLHGCFNVHARLGTLGCGSNRSTKVKCHPKESPCDTGNGGWVGLNRYWATNCRLRIAQWEDELSNYSSSHRVETSSGKRHLWEHHYTDHKKTISSFGEFTHFVERLESWCGELLALATDVKELPKIWTRGIQ